MSVGILHLSGLISLNEENETSLQTNSQSFCSRLQKLELLQFVVSGQCEKIDKIVTRRDLIE
jgi:hypothetical protein